MLSIHSNTLANATKNANHEGVKERLENVSCSEMKLAAIVNLVLTGIGFLAVNFKRESLYTHKYLFFSEKITSCSLRFNNDGVDQGGCAEP